MPVDPNASTFVQASSAFLDWFTSLPGTTFHPSLSIEDLRNRNAGRGIIATSDIPPETDLFTIPRNSIISVETSDLAKKLPELFNESVLSNQDAGTEDQDEDLGTTPTSDLPIPWLNLILVLLHETLRDSSRWRPYLSILPSHPEQFDTLMFWSVIDLAYLQASSIRNKIGRDSADSIFRARILPLVKQHAAIFYDSTDTSKYLTDEDLLMRCHIIGSLIMSYAFDLQPDEDDDDSASSQTSHENNDGWTEDRSKPPMMGMVPMADMLNADAEFNAHLSHGDDALTMTSLRTIKAGEEVLNYYGPLPNAELLRRYGYTSTKHARYDVVEIEWSLIKHCISAEVTDISKSDNLAKQATDLLTSTGSDEDRDVKDGVILDRESGDPTEEGLCPVEAKFTKFPEELVEVVGEVLGEVLNTVSKKRKLTEEEKGKELKRRVLSTLSRIVQARVKMYGTTLESDEKLSRNDRLKSRARMAMEVRMGEKRILQEAEEWTQEMLRKYTVAPSRSGVEHVSKGQPPSKKQKRGR